MSPPSEHQAYRRLIALLPEASFVITVAGEILAANQPAGGLTGRGSACLAGLKLAELLDQPSRERLAEYLSLCSGSRSLLPGSLTVIADSKHAVECRAEAALLQPLGEGSAPLLLLRLLPKSEAVLQFLVLNQKISELSKEIQQRQRAEERMQQLAWLVQSSSEAIFSVDLRGSITSWNLGAEEIYGYVPAEVLGRHFTMLAPADTQDQVRQVVTRALQGNETMQREMERVRKNGQRFWVSVSIAPIRDLNGRIIGASSISRDITQIKAAQEALLRSEKLAVTGRMAATIAHEINNPLEAVTNFIYLAQMEVESGNVAGVRGYLETADAELARVASIVRHTLGFYRDPLGKSWVDLPQLLEGTLHLHHGRIRTRQITVEKRYQGGTPVHGTAGELRQVLANLIANAIDALPQQGKIWVRVQRSCDWSDTSRPGVRVVVADNGTGILSEHMQRLFDPFFTTKESVGTGLGLWVSKTIIDQHGGSIRVRSSTRPGKSGTVFSLFLPIAAQAQSAPLRLA